MLDCDVYVVGGCYICNEMNIVFYNLNYLVMKQVEKVLFIFNIGDYIYVFRFLSYVYYGRLF